MSDSKFAIPFKCSACGKDYNLVSLHPISALLKCKACGKTYNLLTLNPLWMLRQLKTLGAICLMGMTLLTCVDVGCRYLGHPILGSVEIVGFLATLTVAMALPYTHQIKAHIGVEVLVNLFSRRTRALIDICTGISSLILFGLVTWQMTDYAYTLQESGEVSMNLQFPEYMIVYAVAFCFLVFFLMILQDILQHIETLKGKQ